MKQKKMETKPDANSASSTNYLRMLPRKQRTPLTHQYLPLSSTDSCNPISFRLGPKKTTPDDHKITPLSRSLKQAPVCEFQMSRFTRCRECRYQHDTTADCSKLNWPSSSACLLAFVPFGSGFWTGGTRAVTL